MTIARRVWNRRQALAPLCFALALTSCARDSGGQDGAGAVPHDRAAALQGSAAPAAPPSQGAGQAPPAFRAVVEHVDDGDTFTVKAGNQAFRIRLSGVDAPEIGQQSGLESRNRLRALIFGRTVDVRPVGVDQYGRLLACPIVDGQNVCETMVMEGWAWHYRQYSHDARLAALERQARDAGRGLWSEPNPRPPWERRAEERGRNGSGTASVAGPFHGNVKSLTYHAAGCSDYTCASCTAVFATREAAEAAGYHPHRECVRW